MEHVLFTEDAFSEACRAKTLALGPYKLILADVPYGNVVPESWDQADYPRWFALCVEHAAPDATICMWGGVGKYQDRPFLKFAATVEDHYPEWSMDFVTWHKRRAYGTANNYLFTREECLILRRGKPVFNVPLLAKERGYAGFNKDYPAKSKYLRRALVWNDIPELFKGKVHSCHKPDPLYRVLIQTHSSEGDMIFDPCSGSLVTRRAAAQCGRGSVCVEMDEEAAKEGLAYCEGRMDRPLLPLEQIYIEDDIED